MHSSIYLLLITQITFLIIKDIVFGSEMAGLAFHYLHPIFIGTSPPHFSFVVPIIFQ